MPTAMSIHARNDANPSLRLISLPRVDPDVNRTLIIRGPAIRTGGPAHARGVVAGQRNVGPVRLVVRPRRPDRSPANPPEGPRDRCRDTGPAGAPSSGPATTRRPRKSPGKCSTRRATPRPRRLRPLRVAGARRSAPLLGLRRRVALVPHRVRRPRPRRPRSRRAYRGGAPGRRPPGRSTHAGCVPAPRQSWRPGPARLARRGRRSRRQRPRRGG